MEPGTCKISITATGGLTDPVPNPRVLTLIDELHVAGSYNYSLTSPDIQDPSSLSWVASISSRYELYDGTEYSFSIGCKDAVGNVLQSSTNENINYAGSQTIDPVIVFPGDDGCTQVF